MIATRFRHHVEAASTPETAGRIGFERAIGVRVTSMGTRVLRGAPEPVELFRVERPSA